MIQTRCRAGILFIVVSTFAPGPSASGTQHSGSPDMARVANESTRSALDAFGRGDFFEAISTLRDTTAEVPEFDPAYFYLAVVFTQLNRFDLAGPYLHRALELRPRWAAYHHQRGVLLFRKKQWRNALEAFRYALDLGLGDKAHTTWRFIGDTHSALFEWNAALDAYAEAIRLGPRDARSRFRAGKIQLDRDRPDEAVRQLRAAVEIEPDLPGIHAALGRAHMRLGDRPAAIQVLSRAVEADPSDQESRYALGQALIRDGRVDRGRRVITEYRDLSAKIRRANVLFDEARELMESGAHAEGTTGRRKELKEAREKLEDVLELAPRFNRASHALGVVLGKTGETNKGISALLETLENNQLNISAYCDLADLYAAAGRMEAANESISRALVLDPQNPVYASRRSLFVSGTIESVPPGQPPC
jgi:tetratricopeptide (TPR) repeat protein